MYANIIIWADGYKTYSIYDASGQIIEESCESMDLSYAIKQCKRYTKDIQIVIYK